MKLGIREYRVLIVDRHSVPFRATTQAGSDPRA